MESELMMSPVCNNCDECRPKTRTEGFIRR